MLALHQRRHGANGAKHATHDVVDAAAGAQRVAGAAGHVGQPAHHLHHFVQRRAVLVRPGQKAGVVHVDETGVEPRERGVIQPVLGHHARLEVLHHHVSRARQADRHLSPLALAQVDGDALLVAVEHREKTRPRPQQVARAVALHGLDLDDLGPQVGQYHAAGGTHDHVGELHHAQAFKRQAGCSGWIRRHVAKTDQEPSGKAAKHAMLRCRRP